MGMTITEKILEKARSYREEALVIFKKIGLKPEVEKTERLLDGLSTQ